MLLLNLDEANTFPVPVNENTLVAHTVL